MRPTDYVTAKGIGPARFDIQNLVFSQLSTHQRLSSHCMWDVGAGSGCIAIEWKKRNPSCHVYAIEKDDACVQAIRTNAETHKQSIELIHRDAQKSLGDLVRPDAIYHGCISWTDVNLCPVLWDYLLPGGVIVAVIGQDKGLRFAYESVGFIGGEIRQTSGSAHSFFYWVAHKPINA